MGIGTPTKSYSYFLTQADQNHFIAIACVSSLTFIAIASVRVQERHRSS
ncbi:MAG: hypothetical protein ACYTXE_44270 [Nostoc sp.]